MRPDDLGRPVAGTRDRILVARVDAVGDVLLTEPAIRSLAALGPVTLLCSSEGRRAAELIDDVDDVIVFDGPWTGGEPTTLEGEDLTTTANRVIAQIRERRPVLGVIFTSALQSPQPTALLMRMAGVPTICARSTDFCGSLVDVLLRTDPPLHEVERNLELARAAGAPALGDVRIQVRRSPWLGTPLPDRYVVVHPGSSVPARSLTPARWREAIDALAESGIDVVLTGVASDHAAQAVRESEGVAVDLVGRTTLGSLASVLAGAEAVCIGNTGPMHLAAAVGTPVVAAFPPTVPVQRWRPWMTPHVILGDQDIACAECHVRECPFEGHPCADIDTRTIVEAVQFVSGHACR